MTTLFGLTSFFSAVGAYFLFGEKLKIAHLLGMLLMLVCIAGLSFSATKSDEADESNLQTFNITTSNIILKDSGDSSKTVNALLAILFSI